MEGTQLFRRLFEYDYWANGEVLASLSTVGDDAEKPRKFFSHVLGAQRIWLGRFASPEPPTAEPWPVLSSDESRAAIEDLHRRCMALLDSLTPEKFEGNLAYRNLKGMEFQTPIRDVLMHLIIHSAYHRGQVAAALREAGGKPAATDYTLYLRKMKK